MEKNKRLYRKGFTLVEMIVTITILGIVSLIALPVISNITNNFAKEKKNMCVSSIESSLKVYMDAKSEDEFGSQSVGCIEYSYEDASKDGMISLTDDDLEECGLKKDKLVLRVRKANNNYNFEVYNLEDQKSVELHDSSTCNMEVDHAGPGAFFNPDGLPNPKQNTKVQVLLKDDYGFAPNQVVTYKWVKAGSKEPITTDKRVEFKNKIMYGANTLKFEIDSPTGLTGEYEIMVTPVKLMDTVGNSTTDPMYSPIFKFDNTKPNVVIKMYSINADDTPNELKDTKQNEDVSLTNWFKDGYYVDVMDSNDPMSGVKSFSWAENPKDNFNTLNKTVGSAHTSSQLENFLLKDKGMRYATVSVTDNAGNTRTQNITSYNATTYKIHFNPNGGSGGPTEVIKTHGIDLTLPNDIPSKDGWTFIGWSTIQDVTKKDDAKYSRGGTFKENKEMTLYAVWERSISVRFHKNRAHWMESENHSCYFYNDHDTCTVKTPDIPNISCTLKILDDIGNLCEFLNPQGWSTDPNATSATYGKNENITLKDTTHLYSVVTLKYTNPYYAYSPNDHTRVRGTPAGDPIVGHIDMGNRFQPNDALSWYFVGDVWYDYYGNSNYLWINGHCTAGCAQSGWVTATLLVPWW